MRFEIPLAENLSEGQKDGLRELAGHLAHLKVALELPEQLEGGVLAVDLDPEAYKRNAGRKPKGIPQDSELSGMDQEEIDRWLVSHSADEIRAALGVARSTAFTRKAAARRRIEYAVSAVQD